METLRVRHYSRLTVGATGPGWRGRLAERLRRWAGRVDGMGYITVSYPSHPPITREELARALEAGLEHSAEILTHISTAEAVEKALREQRPQLYEERDHDQ